VCAAQAITLTCHATGVIDADLSRSRRGIAEKDHLRTDTSWTEVRRKGATDRNHFKMEIVG